MIAKRGKGLQMSSAQLTSTLYTVGWSHFHSANVIPQGIACHNNRCIRLTLKLVMFITCRHISELRN